MCVCVCVCMCVGSTKTDIMMSDRRDKSKHCSEAYQQCIVFLYEPPLNTSMSMMTTVCMYFHASLRPTYQKHLQVCSRQVACMKIRRLASLISCSSFDPSTSSRAKMARNMDSIICSNVLPSTSSSNTASLRNFSISRLARTSELKSFKGTF